MKKTKETNQTRLVNGARRIRKECQSVVWWSAARVQSIRECEYNSQAFSDWAKLLLFYDTLYERAAASATTKGLPEPPDPLKRESLPKNDLEGVDAILKLPLAAFNKSGIALRCSLEGEPGYIADGWAYRRARKANERVIRPDEMKQMLELKEESPAEFNEMWKAIWIVKEILD